MKKSLLFLMMMFLWGLCCNANVNPYTFTSYIGTYTAISGGTVLGTVANDDQVFNANTVGAPPPVTATGFPIGFSFTYNGIVYDRFAVNTNGWILLGTGSFTIGSATAAQNYTPISTAGPVGFVSAISAMGANLQGQPGAELSFKTEGSSPGKVLTVQWKNYTFYNLANVNLIFQIKLYETSNEVRFSYSYCNNNTMMMNVQVGLRGATNSDFHNRTTTTSWSMTTKGIVNTASCRLYATVVPGNGQTFVFVPPILPPNCANIVSPLDGELNVPVSATLNWTAGGGSPPTGYKLYFGTDNPPTNIVNGTNIGLVTTYDPTPDMLYSTPYYWKIVPTNSGGDATGCPVWSFTTGPDPTIIVFPHCESFDGTTFPPYGWITMKTAGTGTPGTWDRQTSGTNPVCSPHTGAGMARYNCYNLPSGTAGILVTPPINFPSDQYKVSFWMYRDNGFPTITDHVNVYFNTSPSLAGATLLGTINRATGLSPPEANTGWYTYDFLMPPGAAGPARYIVFEGVSQYGNNIFIDDVCLYENIGVILNSGIDKYSVPQATIRFGGDYPPLPADFFGPGSDPFDGLIAFKGLPSDGSQNPDPDVAINRTASVTMPAPPSSHMIPVEMVQLDLVSQTPIRVTKGGGTVQSFFDVYYHYQSPVPPGGMTEIVLMDQYGGNFSLQQLSFYPLLTFINHDDPGESYVFDPLGAGYPPLEYTSTQNCSWTLSPLPGEFDPIGDDDFNLYTPSGSILTLIPFLIREENNFNVVMNETGMVEMGSGNGYNGGEWFYYPNFNWWNVWWYDHPVRPDRVKYIKYPTMTLLPRNMSASSSVEIVYTYSTTSWPGWISTPRPPLPPDVPTPAIENQMIARTPTLYQYNGMITQPIVIPLLTPYSIVTHNPEWMSVDIRGYNFILNGLLNHVCFKPSIRGADFGDAPYPYPTLLAVNGARHTIVPGIFMGFLIDGEADGLPHVTALGDDNNNLDDEDGVIFNTALTPGQQATITVQSSIGNIFLQGWIDFNRDGDWSDAGEQIAINQVTVAGPNLIVFVVPGNADPGQTFARFRLSTMPGLSFIGAAPNGEVEDHLVNIEQPVLLDFGDAPDPSYPTLLASDGARHMMDGFTFLGLTVDGEADGLPSINATGDDLSNIDDEDGVTFLWPLASGNPCKVKVTASVTNAYLNCWIDFNRNGSWGDAGEQVFVDKSLVAGDNFLTFVAPVNVVPGNTIARFRFSHQTGLSYTGLAGDGEVEDHLVTIEEFGNIKWQQLFDNTVTGIHSDQSGYAADDWICHGGQVTDVHWWGNYELDIYGQEERGQGINHFEIEIYSNGAGLPGMLLKSYSIPFSSITEVNTGSHNNEMSPIYYYEVDLNEPFAQQAGMTYWICIKAISNNPTPPFNAAWRWQEANRWFGSIGFPAVTGTPTSPWMPISWYGGKFSDMAFRITSTIIPYDYGDAPDPTYPTLLVSNGARHANSGLKLGVLIDLENDGQPNATATGDDNNPAGADDEDGVWWPCNFTPGHTTSLKITSTGAGFLNAWFDFNANGSWADLGEQIFLNQNIVAGTNNLSVTVPANAVVGGTFARFRLSTQQNLGYTGLAPNGEVEDYQFFIEPAFDRDYGDAPDQNYKTLAASNGARHSQGPPAGIFMGNSVDYEIDGQPGQFANLDDIAPAGAADDEDGVKFLAPLIPGAADSVQIKVSMLGPLLQAWIDFNGDGDWDEFNEQILSNVNPTALTANYTFNIPAGAVVGKTYARFRFSTMPNLAYYGCVTNGEVEDYVIYIGEYDLGDAPDPNLQYPTYLASNGAIHKKSGLFMGVRIDAEPDGQPNATATGDDLNPLGLNDEDGVWWPCNFVPGHANTVKVTVNGPGFLSAWFDFNADGDWNENGEQVFTDVLLNAGSTDLVVSVPGYAQVGTTYARFRFSSLQGLFYSGYAPDGEVEDYSIVIEAAEPMDFGDAPDPGYPTLAASNGARHYQIPGMPVFLGNLVDTEPDGQPGAGALNDDNIPAGGIDDEDGIVFITPLIPGAMATITVTANMNGNPLQGWIDFNQDGDWFDAGEQIFMNKIINAGAQNINFNVPAGATLGNTYARFRYSTTGNLMPYGCAQNGEVEDYQVLIGQPTTYDWGDLPEPTYPTVAASNGPNHVIGNLYLGGLIDSDANGQPHISALGDDNNNLDDEDGILFTTNLIPGNVCSIDATASINGGFLQGWIDLNQDGDFVDPGEQIIFNSALNAGTNAVTFTINPAAALGATYARFRLSTSVNLGYTGAAPDGEVEDYKVFIVNPGQGKMHWDQLPDLEPTGMDVDITWVPTADDFLCTETGPVNRISMWMSFADDALPPYLNYDTVRLQIYTDVPAGVMGPWSMPGDLLWSKTYYAQQYNATIVSDNSPEWWYDPATQWWQPNNHQIVVRFDFDLGPDAFDQVQGNIYWLEVKYMYQEPPVLNNTLGWKTTQHAMRFNDDAVWWNVNNPNFPVGWVHHLYPGAPMPHPWAGQSFDMAFIINPPPFQEQMDFGDAPDANYQTLLANNGARHPFWPAIFMGNLIDLETNGQPNAAATGDNINNLNDEDGVVFNTALVKGQPAVVTVTCSMANIWLQGWIDFDGDGDWAEGGEQVITNWNTNVGPNVINIIVPPNATIGSTYARFRLSTMPGLTSFGLAPNGEVEDYLVDITAPVEFDWGDLPDPAYPTLASNNGPNHIVGPLFLGVMIDSETNGLPHVSALGDDLNNLDDEEGVVFTSNMIPGQSATLSVTVSQGGGYLQGWIDFNKDGDFNDAGEQIFTNYALPAGTNPLTFNVAPSAQLGATYARFRISTLLNLGYTGPAPDGEVEDYKVFIVNPGQGKMHWDQLPDLDPTGMDVDITWVPTADDFMCTETGPINRISMWVSFADDMLPPVLNDDTVRLQIFSDIPAGVQHPYSTPGDLLWSKTYFAGQYTATIVSQNSPEWWYDPATQWWWPNNHLIVVRFDFNLGSEPFEQVMGNIYWLEAKYIFFVPPNQPPSLNNTLGWKTCKYDLRFNDDAVWWNESNLNFPFGWVPHVYPGNPMPHPWAGQTFDMAFVINPPEELLDFGDIQGLDSQYPTLLVNNGARHRIDNVTYLGNLIDAEPDGIPTLNADGDDLNNLDDEDGVGFPWPFIAGSPCKIKVQASVGDALLNTWIDFDRNGSWDDPGEHVFVDMNIIAGNNFLTFMVPANAVPGQTYARFRFSHQPALTYSGYAFDGEVEDYAIIISEYGEIKWQQLPEYDLPGLHAGTSNILADDWICSGGQVTDLHWWGNYELDDYGNEKRFSGINHFLIHIHSNAGCLPGGIVQSYVVPFSSISEVYTGNNNVEGSPVYSYEYVLPYPFAQVTGVTYWLSIIPVPNNMAQPPQWRWQEANRWFYPINCGAAYLDPFGNWQTFTWPAGTMIKYSDLAFAVTSMPDISLNLKAYLEGLYAGGGLLNKAQDEFGDHFAGDTADMVTVELHNALNYSLIEYSFNNASLATDGSIYLTVPYYLNGNYYVTIKHRNSIETTTANPLSFASGFIVYDFTFAASQAYGSNQLFMVDAYAFYGGDVTQDGLVDSSDMIPIDNDAANFVTGYVATDVNGDGLVDSSDMIIVDNNASNFVSSVLP